MSDEDGWNETREYDGQAERRRAAEVAEIAAGLPKTPGDVFRGLVGEQVKANRLPGHGEVLGERREIRVAVRNQMDGIRPIEQAVLTYEWTPPTERAGGMEPGCWTFEGMTLVVQGLDGAAKPGTPLSAAEFAQLGPSLGWVWDLVHALRPRG